MFRSRRISFTLVLVALLALSLGQAAAAPKPQNKGKPAKTRMSWSVRRLVQPLVPGQSATATVELTSSMDLSNVTLRVPGGLGRIVTLTPAAGEAFDLKANTPKQITLQFAMPADSVGAQGGVVQVRVGHRNMPAALHVFAGTPSAAEAEEQERTTERPGAGAAKEK